MHASQCHAHTMHIAHCMLSCFACFLFSHPLFIAVICSTHWICIPGQNATAHSLHIHEQHAMEYHNTGLQLQPAQYTTDTTIIQVWSSLHLSLRWVCWCCRFAARRSSRTSGSFLCTNRNHNAHESCYAYRWRLLRSRLESLAAALFSGLSSILPCRIV